jgi:hypothetical protein
MFLPPGLVIVIASLFIAFAVILAGIIRKQRKDIAYRKLANGSSDPQYSPSGYAATSYQNAASADYALPTNQKVVTYCVIDGRLIDQ